MFKNMFNFSHETPKSEKKPWYETIVNSPFKKALMLSLLLSGSPKSNVDGNGSGGEKMVSDSVTVFKDNLESCSKTDFELQQRFFVKDENGNEVFSPWSIIAPFQLNIGQGESYFKELNITVPHEYARQFNSAKESDPEAQVKLKEYLANQIKAQMADDFASLDPSSISREVVERDHPGVVRQGTRNFEVEDVVVTGFTSPEGPEYKGSSTINSQKVDQENISLGELRAENVRPMLIQALKEQGINLNEDDVKDFSISSEEIQLNDQERNEIIEIAKKLNITGFNDEEIIFNTFVAYNDKSINDSEAMSKLNQIIATKRMVSITVHLKGDEKNIFSIPLPLLLILPLPLLFRRRKNNKTDLGDNLAESEKSLTSSAVDEKHLLIYEEDEPIFAEAKKIISDEMVKQTVTVDLFNNIDNQFTISNGIDYREICKQIQPLLDNYGTRQLEKIVSDMILEKWTEHDLSVRRASGGFTEENINQGLDYKNQKEQVAWSIVHARELIGLANAQRSVGDDVQGFNNEFIRRYKTLTN